MENQREEKRDETIAGFRKRPRLGDMLVEAGIITQEQLAIALAEQKRSHERLGRILVKLGFTTEKTVVDCLSSQLGIPYVSLAEIGEIPKAVIELIPDFIVTQRKLIPISMEDNVLTVAMADPMDIFAIDDIKLMIGEATVNPVIASEKEIDGLIEKYYGMFSIMEEIMKDVETKDMEVIREEDKGIDLSKLAVDSWSAPVVRLVNHLLRKAIRQGASDIHIEPYEKHVRTRYRIDGVLHDADSTPKALQAAVISRIKIISHLDIAERRLPQDGRAKVRIGGRDIDLRISVTPTNFGEKVVMRILDPASLCLDLKLLGFEEGN